MEGRSTPPPGVEERYRQKTFEKLCLMPIGVLDGTTLLPNVLRLAIGMNSASRVFGFVMLLGSLLSWLAPAADRQSCPPCQKQTARHHSCHSAERASPNCCTSVKSDVASCHDSASLASESKECRCLKTGSVPEPDKAAPAVEKPQPLDSVLLVQPLTLAGGAVLFFIADFVQETPRIRGPDLSAHPLRAPPCC